MSADTAGPRDASQESTKAEQAPSLSKQIVDLMNADTEPEDVQPIGDQTQEDQPDPSTIDNEEHEVEEKEETDEGAEEEAQEEKDEDAAPKVSNEWPESAKVRVAEETAKRKTRTEERDKAIARATAAEEQLAAAQAQLAQASRPQATRSDPLMDVVDAKTLAERRQNYEDLLTFCEENPDGGIELVYGKDDKGNDLKGDFDRKQISKMQRTAQKMLDVGLPNREKFLAVQAQAMSLAAEAYPKFTDAKDPWVAEAQQILAVVPELRRLPDHLMWIGHALSARDAFVEKSTKKNGDRSVSANAKKILSAPKMKVAPGIPKGRTFSPPANRSVESVEQAKTQMRKRGDDESMEDYVGAVLEAGRARRSG